MLNNLSYTVGLINVGLGLWIQDPASIVFGFGMIGFTAWISR